MEPEAAGSPHRESIKCVVVGDTGVGKTRLICAKACNQKVPLDQLTTVHIPTVWAIDQYRMCRKVLERSNEVVDGVDVSLRLWDTFGDHQTDRRFAYGQSDVVLLCFSVACPRSLKHVQSVWYPEIRRACPFTPIVLVGCKNDLRHLVFEPHLHQLVQAKKPFLQPILPTDIIFPEQGRLVAEKIGAPYYEASVNTFSGIHDVFVNAIRAALCRRKAARLWMSSYLRTVLRPQAQKPYLCPQPNPPEFVLSPSTFAESVCHIFERNSEQTDLEDCCIIFDDGSSIFSHRLLLCAISCSFAEALICRGDDFCSCYRRPIKCVSEEGQDTDTDPCSNLTDLKQGPVLPPEDISTVTSYDLTSPSNSSRYSSNMVWNSLKSASEHSISCSQDSSAKPITCFLLSIKSGISPKIISPCTQQKRRVLRSRSIPWNTAESESLHEEAMKQAPHAKPLNQVARSEIFKSVEVIGGTLTIAMAGDITLDEFKNIMLSKISPTPEKVGKKKVDRMTKLLQFLKIEEVTIDAEGRPACGKNDFCEKMDEYGVANGLFADATVTLEDGQRPVNRFMLASRCDMMRAMLSGPFVESASSQVIFPGLHLNVFLPLMTYLYTDTLKWNGNTNLMEHLDLLEVANRLCLPHLCSLIEQALINILNNGTIEQTEICEDAVLILEFAQLYNASQLAQYCLYLISINYDVCMRECPKMMESLSSTNLEFVRKHRWPPVWYIYEEELYSKRVSEQLRMEERISVLKRSRSVSGSGCLCLKSLRQHHDSF